eukprot:4058253-Prymnesium_polylepis.1
MPRSHDEHRAQWLEPAALRPVRCVWLRALRRADRARLPRTRPRGAPPRARHRRGRSRRLRRC